MTTCQSIINFLLEDEEDFEWKEVVYFDSHEEVDAWLETNLPALGFEQKDVGIRGWEKTTGNRQVCIGSSTVQGHVFMVLYRRTMADRWQDQETQSVPCGVPILDQLKRWKIIG